MVRESMRGMPAGVQNFLTWLTAKPLPEDVDKKLTRTPHFHIWTTVIPIGFGAILAGYAYTSGSFFLWLLGFIFTTSGIKKMQVMICHNCAHNMVFASRVANMRAGHLISGLLLLKPFDIYKKEHLLHHDHKTLLTDDDDTLSFLKTVVGLTPGDTICKMWLKLIYSAVSPVAIFQGAIGRITATATAKARLVSILTLGFWALLIGGALMFGLFDILFFAWLLPVFAGFHISSTFRLAAEHTWPSLDVLRRRGIDFVSESTTGVFIGEELRVPVHAPWFIRYGVITIWAVKMLTFHLFVRIFIMVGDTPCHDFHHRRPKSKDWPSYIIARERDLNSGSKPYPTNYVDVWGYITAVTMNFRNYQNAREYYSENKFSEQGLLA